VFKNEPLYIQQPIDFRVSLRGVTDSKYEINIGPRFRPNLIQDFNVPSSASFLGRSFIDFYSPQSAEFAVFLYAFLVKEKRKNEISQYFPLTALDTDTETGLDVYLTPNDASGGRFFIEKTGKTLFWMKIPYGYSRGGSGDYEKLSTEWARIEQGTAIPKNSGLKYDELGNLTYTLYIPIFSIEPINGRLNIEYFDCGSIRYFSDIYKVEQGGKKKDLPFTYDKVSGYYRN
jgi:hypothetical protein